MTKPKKEETTTPTSTTPADLITLPTSFPSSCLPPVVAALRGSIPDPKGALHCALTLECWVAGLYIRATEPTGPPTPAAAQAAAAKAQSPQAQAQARAEWADRLEALHGEGADTHRAAAAGAFDWRGLLQVLLGVLPEILAKL